MIDRISMKTLQPLHKDALKSSLGTLVAKVIQRPRTDYHLQRHEFWGQEHRLFIVHYDPMGFTQFNKIELNPSWFHGYSEMDEVLNKCFDLNNARISRTDFNADVPLSMEYLSKTVYVSRKGQALPYPREILIQSDIKPQGLRFGKGSETIAMYNRAGKTGFEGVLSRIEPRKFREKLPITTYSDLYKLDEYNPFCNVKTIKVVSGAESVRNQKKIREWERILSQSVCAHDARRLLNKHYNFRRDYKGILGPDPSFPDLNQIHQKEFREWMGR